MFCSREYLDFIKKGNFSSENSSETQSSDSDSNSSEDDEDNDEDKDKDSFENRQRQQRKRLKKKKIKKSKLEEFGLEDDCPPFPSLYNYMKIVAGASITAARCLSYNNNSNNNNSNDNNSPFKVAINWHGGWHHGKPDMAAGFCYINDAVLCILELRKTFDKVLYFDIDLHHGDGVESAFIYTDKVYCASIHKYATGFYPGTGNVDEIGRGRGKGYSLNFPVKDGLNDAQFEFIANSLLDFLVSKFQPSSIVLQCGVDSLVTDPHGSFNVTPVGVYKIVQHALSFDIPTVILGGGGYHSPSVAKCWTVVTACSVLGQSYSQLPELIPDHLYFSLYGPDFQLSIPPSKVRSNLNTQESIEATLNEVKRHWKDESD